jgi:hypothetical protein
MIKLTVCDVVTDRMDTTATTVSMGNHSQIGRTEEAGVPASAQTAALEVEASPLAALPPITFEQQTKSPSFANIITYLTDGTLPNDKATARQVLLQSEQYTIEHGLLVHLGINRQKRLHELDLFTPGLCTGRESYTAPGIYAFGDATSRSGQDLSGTKGKILVAFTVLRYTRICQVVRSML